VNPRPVAGGDGAYRVAEGGLPFGPTLGGPDLTVTLLANGAIESIHSMFSGGQILLGLDVHHWEASTGLRLSRDAGEFTLRPECHVHDYRLSAGIAVEKTTFVLCDEREQPALCYVVFRLHNQGEHQVTLDSVAVARLRTSVADAIQARWDEAARALVVFEPQHSERTRALLVSEQPASWAVTSDHARMVDEHWLGAFPGTIDLGGIDPLGAVHVRTTIDPGASASFWFGVAALPQGPGSIDACVHRAPPADVGLETTRKWYAHGLNRTVLLSPTRDVDLGVYWAKANMLRVMRRTRTGPGFTNNPGKSTSCVGRDAAWFVHGCDCMDPDFSAALIRGFAQRQEADGKIVEYYDLRSGETADDGLNVNDNTPLFVLAVWHHAVTTNDRAFLEELYPRARQAVEQLLAGRDERGLVHCTADGTGARGIVGWRNIIKGYRISGATTELNSEAFAALQKLSTLAKILGNQTDEQRYAREASALRESIERHLRNAENGLYYLTLDVDGRPRSEVTSDLVFPVIFGVSDDQTSIRIVERLRAADFWTAAGLRTAPRDAPQYHPVNGSGLLGGVWAAVNFWYAFAAARFVTEIMLEALRETFVHYGRKPRVTNTVPGEFSEWLHGETLVNQGMMLSPWFAPRYLWAAIEGACGLEFAEARIRIAPRLPSSWNWFAVRNVPVHGDMLSWFVVRADGQRLFATGTVETTAPFERYERDVTNEVHVEGKNLAVAAFARADEVTVLIGNQGSHTETAALQPEGALQGMTAQRRYESFYGHWKYDLGNDEQSRAATIADGHFVLVVLQRAYAATTAGVGER